MAVYLYNSGVEIKNDETITGLTDGQMDPAVKWKFPYENALVQPVREVLDVHPGQYAAGGRGE